MRNRMVQKYAFRAEVAPVLVIGVLLDLVGRYACAHWLQPALLELNRLVYHSDHGLIAAFGDQLFLDMSGTCYAAVMLGPWWGAVVGVTSNAINGGFYDAYFPFGVVNVLGGLVWGYLAERYDLRARLAERTPRPLDVARTYVAMALAGGLVGGLASGVTHLILYPPMNHPLAHGVTYDLLRRLQPFQNTKNDVGLMFAGDLVRDLADKSISVLIGLGWVLAAPAVSLGLPRVPKGERFKTDTSSVFAFAIVNSAYLLAARLTKPTIQLMKTDRLISWLHYPLVIAWLYVPIALSLLAYLLFTYDSESRYGRQIDARRVERQRLYDEIDPPTPWVFIKTQYELRLGQGRHMIGLIASLAFWPIGKQLNSTISVTVYFAVVVLSLASYTYQNRNFLMRCAAAARRLTVLHQWLSLGDRQTPAELLASLTGQLSSALQAAASALRVLGEVTYQPMYVPALAGGAAGRGPMPRLAGGQVALVAIAMGSKTIDHKVRRQVDSLIDTLSPDQIHLVSLTSPGQDSELGSWLVKTQKLGVEVSLLTWCDLEELINDGRRIDAAQVLARARLRSIEIISKGDPMASTATVSKAVDPAALARRALPSLAHIIEHLPHGSTILDVGAGRGRHTYHGLLTGHFVMAIERNEAAIADLRAGVAQLGKASRRATVLAKDYMTLEPDEVDAAELVIAAGMLQHATSHEDLAQRLKFLSKLAAMPCARIYIEMLFDMLFDGQPADDGRVVISIAEFEQLLEKVFPASDWTIERVAGPIPRRQDFTSGPRSFMPISRTVDLTSVEYVVMRLD